MVLPAVVFLLLLIAPAPIASDECLDCHDGTVAAAVTPEKSHIWHVDYAAVQPFSAKFLRRPTALSGFGSTVAIDMLVNGYVECTSCHVPHDDDSSALDGTPGKFRMRAERITLVCRACHDPK